MMKDPFRQLVETASCLIVILREDYSIAFINAFGEQLTGYDSAAVLGLNYIEKLVTGEDQPVVKLALDRVGARNTIETFDNSICCRDGSRRWLEWSAQRLPDFEGRPGLIAIGHDVTLRHQATEDLHDREARLRAVLDTAVDGIITIDDRGIVQSVNAAAERIFGYSAAEILGSNISMLMPSPYREEHDDYLANYVRTGEKKIIGIGREVEGRRKDGTVFPCSLAVSEVALPGQRLFTGILRDMTEQKRAEERALQSERLAAIGQTVAGLAHESRNAFQRSQACLETLSLELAGKPDQLLLVERTQRALSHLHRLYEEVRDYAAPIKLDRQPCDVAHLWRDAWSHLEVVRREKAVELVETLHAADTSCIGDWFALGQVFRNIFENAIAACPELGRIEVTCRDARLKYEPALQVSIRDNGPGLEPACRSRIFEAFYTTKTKGTGLGLAIAQRIIDAHGGSIEVGDTGTGAEFIVTLPRK